MLSKLIYFYKTRNVHKTLDFFLTKTGEIYKTKQLSFSEVKKIYVVGPPHQTIKELRKNPESMAMFRTEDSIDILEKNFRAIPTHIVLSLEKSISVQRQSQQLNKWQETWDEKATVDQLLQLFRDMKMHIRWHRSMYILYYKSLVNSVYFSEVKQSIEKRKSWILSILSDFFESSILFKAFPELGSRSLTRNPLLQVLLLLLQVGVHVAELSAPHDPGILQREFVPEPEHPQVRLGEAAIVAQLGGALCDIHLPVPRDGPLEQDWLDEVYPLLHFTDPRPFHDCQLPRKRLPLVDGHSRPALATLRSLQRPEVGLRQHRPAIGRPAEGRLLLTRLPTWTSC